MVNMSIQVFDVKNVNECLEFNPRTGDVVGVNNYKLAELILDKVRMVTVIETKEILAYYAYYDHCKLKAHPQLGVGCAYAQ